MCSNMYDGDSDPTVASLNPFDNISKNNTVSALQLDKGSMTFEELMNNVSKYNKRCKGFLNEKKEADKVADSYFGDAELMSEKDYKDNYAKYKEKLFNDWKFPLKVSEQQKILKDWQQKLKDFKEMK